MINFFLVLFIWLFSFAGTNIGGYDYTDVEIEQFKGITSSPSTSTLGKAKVYLDATTGKLKCSENGGLYVSCLATDAITNSDGSLIISSGVISLNPSHNNTWDSTQTISPVTVTNPNSASLNINQTVGYTGYAFGSGDKNYSVYGMKTLTDGTKIFSPNAGTITATEPSNTIGDPTGLNSVEGSGSGYVATGKTYLIEIWAIYGTSPHQAISINNTNSTLIDDGSSGSFEIDNNWTQPSATVPDFYLIKRTINGVYSGYQLNDGSTTSLFDSNIGWTLTAIPTYLNVKYINNVAGGGSVATAYRAINTTTSKYNDQSSDAFTDDGTWSSGTTSTPTSTGVALITNGDTMLMNTGGNLSFFGATAVSQRTGDVMQGLIDFGLFNAGSHSMTLNGGQLVAGTVSLSQGQIYSHAGTTLGPSINIPSGVAPTSPTTGDMWFDGSHLMFRIGSTTWQLDSDVSNADGTITIGTSGGTQTVSLSLGHANTWTAEQKFLLTTEQVRIGYDTSNYLTFTTSSTGSTTLALTGTAPIFTFSQSATFTSGINLSATNIVTDTTTGMKIGTGTTQKVGFFNATPVAQQAAATDLGTVLSNMGIRVAGTAYGLTTSASVALTGTTNNVGTITTGTWSGTAIAIAKGGTNATSMTTSNALVIYNGSSLVTISGGNGTSGQYLAANTGSAPSWANIQFSQISSVSVDLNSQVTNTLQINHGGTGGTSFTTNGVAIGSGSTYGFTAAGTTGQILRGNTSSAPTWTTATYPATTTVNRILYSSATSTIGEITTANSSVLVTDGSGVPSLSTTLPAVTVTTSLTVPITKSTAAQTTVNCATSGSIIASQPNQGTSYKNVLVYCNACLGAAVYTYPTAFSQTPEILSQSLGGIAVANTTTITVTGTSSTGFIEVNGY